MKGRFIIVDGIDGSGKGAILETIREHYDHVFDLARYTKENNQFPDPKEINQDIVISHEPTDLYVGKAIKEQVLSGRYSALTTAHAFALDRQILYTSFLIPALALGKTIIQERGIMSSLVYQPIQHEKITLRELMNIEGNRIAIRNAPDYIIIVKADPDKIAARSHSKVGIFDDLFFQRKIEERFESGWLKDIFERFGSKVLYLDGDCSLQQLRERSLKLFKDYCLEGQKTL